MATKIYFPSSGAPAVTPASWVFTNQINPVTYKAATVKAATAMTTITQATGTTSPTTRAMARFVIGPLAAQTISGTVQAVIRASESSTGANAQLAIAVKIIKSDGTDRGTLLAVTSSDSATSPYELNTSLDSRRAWSATETQPLTLISQTATAGDYLVIELGFRSATTTTRNISLRLGDAAASDLTYGDAETNDYNGWAEFSGTLSFIKTGTVLQNNETDTPHIFTRQKSKGIAQNNETSTVQSVVHQKKRIVGQLSETSVPQTINKTKTLSIGQAIEIDISQEIIRGIAQIIVTINQIVETNIVQSVTRVKSYGIGQLIEAEIIHAIARIKVREISNIINIDESNVITAKKIYLLGQVENIDSVQFITPTKLVILQSVEEASIAQALFPTKKIVIVRVEEIGAAFSISTNAADGYIFFVPGENRIFIVPFMSNQTFVIAGETRVIGIVAEKRRMEISNEQ